jgi:hypothetical protein
MIVAWAMLGVLMPTASSALQPIAADRRLEPQTIRWRGQTIRLAMSSSLNAQNSGIKADSDVLGAVDRALATWHGVTGLEFLVQPSDRQSISPSGVSGDGVSLITIGQTPENLQLFAKDPFAESARTRVFYNRKAAITEADIVLNPLQQFSTDGTYGTFDLETTLTHEIGHLIGLRHSEVLGSVMADRIPRNGTEKFGPRGLSASDVAEARQLYEMESDTCCGAVAGHLTLKSGKSFKGTTVWAEDVDGIVAGQVSVASDGSYWIGGLDKGKYRIFWLKADGSVTGTGSMGQADVEKSEVVNVSQRLQLENSGFTLERIGSNFQPADSALRVRPGRQYVISIAGRNLVDLTDVSFSSQGLHVDLSSLAKKQDFGNKIDVFNITVSIDVDIPEGAYTLFCQRGDGIRTAIIGAIVVSR